MSSFTDKKYTTDSTIIQGHRYATVYRLGLGQSVYIFQQE